MSKIFFDSIPVLRIEDETPFINAVKDIQRSFSQVKAKQIDDMIFKAYGLDEKDIQTIGYIEIT